MAKKYSTVDDVFKEMAAVFKEKFHAMGPMKPEDDWTKASKPMDSLQILRMVFILENHFNIRFEPNELSPANFNSPMTTSKLIFNKLN